MQKNTVNQKEVAELSDLFSQCKFQRVTEYRIMDMGKIDSLTERLRRLLETIFGKDIEEISIWDILSKTEEDYKKNPNFGPKSLEELKQFIEQVAVATKSSLPLTLGLFLKG